MINVVSEEDNKLCARRIELQADFNKFTAQNGFDYATWLNPPAGHFFEGYKAEMDSINETISPALDYIK